MQEVPPTADDFLPEPPGPPPATTPSTPMPSSSLRRAKELTPMQALIARANAHPSSPFSPAARRPSLGASRSALARIAPLHATRRPPPPPAPPKPKPKKTKKQLEREERWEEELAEMDGWAAMDDGERAALRRAKWEHEMGVD
jgi:hypothetical protein